MSEYLVWSPSEKVQVASRFRTQQPYRFVDMSGVFRRDVLADCAAEIEEYIQQIPAEKNIYGSYRKHKLSDLNAMPHNCGAFISYLNGKEFISELEQITGIEGLMPDPGLQGGGIHAIGSGGFLKVHTDFNWNAKLRLHRRLNLLIYLNHAWQENWGGAIELWSPDVSHKISQMPPMLGNALLFATTDSSYHGHPDPLTCPEGVFRKSIAMYYYSPSRPDEEVEFGKSGMTNYVERPGEKFATDRLRRLRHKIQLGLKKLTN